MAYLQVGAAGSNVTFHVLNTALIRAPRKKYADSIKMNFGYTGGVGFEAMLTQQFIVGIDYLFTYYGDMVITAAEGGLPAGLQQTEGWFHTKFTTHCIGLYLKYKFSL